MDEKITQFRDWFTNHKRNIIIFLLVFLIATLSFGLGYLVNREFNHAPIVIEKYSDTTSAIDRK